MLLDLSTPEKEGLLQVSKSRKLPVLIDEHEMENLMDALQPLFIFDVSRPISLECAQIDRDYFLGEYALYINTLRKGESIQENPHIFSTAFTVSTDLLYAMPLANGNYLIKPRLPIIQLQRHHFIYSDTFHSGVLSSESISWGIQFSYPQLFLDPKTKAIGKVEKNASFPNTALFHRLAKWVRDNTLPTPFCIGEKCVNQPMRLGKNCFSWINQHKGLRDKGLYVKARKNPSNSH